MSPLPGMYSPWSFNKKEIYAFLFLILFYMMPQIHPILMPSCWIILLYPNLILQTNGNGHIILEEPIKFILTMVGPIIQWTHVLWNMTTLIVLRKKERHLNPLFKMTPYPMLMFQDQVPQVISPFVLLKSNINVSLSCYNNHKPISLPKPKMFKFILLPWPPSHLLMMVRILIFGSWTLVPLTTLHLHSLCFCPITLFNLF